MYFGNNIDLGKNQLLNARTQNLGANPSPSGTDKGLLYYLTTDNTTRVWNGTTNEIINNVIEAVSGSGAISVSAPSGRSVTVSIAAATGSVPGTMSASDFTKLGAATAASTNSTLVLRDGSGNFSAGTITAALTGTASNATQLNGQADTYYLSRTNHTGTQLASTISNFDTQVRTSRLDQMAAPTASVVLNSQKITGLADPTAATDAANKQYVDSVATGLDVKASVRLASTAAVTVTYTATAGASGRGQITNVTNSVDGTTVVAGNRILLKNQATAAQNGIWVVTTAGTGANGVWDRATDFDTDVEVTSGAFTFVEEGTQASSGWILTNSNPITIGGASGTALSWAQFNGSASYIAGNGLSLGGSTFTVVGTTNRISVSGAGVDIAATYVGQTSITTLGTITTGTWTGTAIAVANGGTGATSAATARTNLSSTGVPLPQKFSATIGDGSTTTLTVTHNLNTRDAVTSIMDTTTNEIVFANVVNATVNTVTVAFAVAPATNAYRVTVVG